MLLSFTVERFGQCRQRKILLLEISFAQVIHYSSWHSIRWKWRWYGRNWSSLRGSIWTRWRFTAKEPKLLSVRCTCLYNWIVVKDTGYPFLMFLFLPNNNQALHPGFFAYIVFINIYFFVDDCSTYKVKYVMKRQDDGSWKFCENDIIESPWHELITMPRQDNWCCS